MECFAQYLDDLEDLCYAFALKWERIRHFCKFVLFVMASVSLQLAGILLALSHPPIAKAVVALMLVALLYRAVVSNGPKAASPA